MIHELEYIFEYNWTTNMVMGNIFFYNYLLKTNYGEFVIF